jgi:hypothetical protein
MIGKPKFPSKKLGIFPDQRTPLVCPIFLITRDRIRESRPNCHADKYANWQLPRVKWEANAPAPVKAANWENPDVRRFIEGLKFGLQQ